MARVTAPVLLVLAALGAPLAGCRTAAPRRAGPAAGEGALYLYVSPFEPDAARLAFAVASVAALRADGVAVPLEVVLSDLSGRDTRSQRLVARGALPAGAYAGLRVAARGATLQGDAGRSDLLAADAVTLDAPFAVEEGRSLVRWLHLRAGAAVREGVSFSPEFAVVVPPAPNPNVIAAALGPDENTVFVFDRVRREVLAALTAADEVGGLALDPRRVRLYASLPRRDEVQVFDLITGAEVARHRLLPRDTPGDLLLTGDGGALLVACRGAASVVFLDPASGIELARARTGEEPGRMVLDRTGRQAWVPNAGSATVTALDLAMRAPAATHATDAEPSRLQLNRAGTRLLVLHRGSPYLTALALPEGRRVGRTFVGPSARSLRMDPRTDFLYVGQGDEGRLEVFDPFSFVPVGSVLLPDAAGDAAIDDAQNALLVALPARGSVAVVDLTSRQVRGLVDVGPGASLVVVAGERR